MRAHQMLMPALILAISTPAAAQDQVPAALRTLKPHQIVETVIAERGALGLSATQAARLDSVHLAVRNETHRYENAPGLKAHQNLRMRPMISKRRAYYDALAVLTPEQHTRATALFNDPAYELPNELRQPAPQAEAQDPLEHHARGTTPVARATNADKVGSPLQHRGGEFPTAQDAQSAKQADPMTHRN